MWDQPGEVRAPVGRQKGNYEVMLPVAVRAKPNSSTEEWSDPIFLLKALPAAGALPLGTDRHHLFTRKTSHGKPVEVPESEYEEKMKSLKKTVGTVLEMKSATARDKSWWVEFFEKRRAGIPAGTAPDPEILKRVKQLFWGVQPVERQAEVNPMPDETAAAERELAELEASLVPRETAILSGEFGRKRAVGYVVRKVDDDGKATECNMGRKQSEVTEDAITAIVSRRGSEPTYAKRIQVMQNCV